MLTGLRLGNFKAFGETQHIPIKPLTLIFGANSAGKSSIIQGLLLCYHANESGNLDVHKTTLGGATIDLGRFRQYIHRRDYTRHVTLSIQLVPSSESLFTKLEVDNTEIVIDIIIGIRSYSDESTKSSEIPEVLSYRVVSSDGLLLVVDRDDAGTFRLCYFDIAHPIAGSLWNDTLSGWDPNLLNLVTSKIIEESVEEMLSMGCFFSGNFIPDEHIKAYSEQSIGSDRVMSSFDYFKGLPTLEEQENYLSGYTHAHVEMMVEILIEHIASEFNILVNDVYYLGPLRAYPPRNLIFFKDREIFRLSDADWLAGGARAWDAVWRYDLLRNDVNDWLNKKLKTPYELVVRRFTADDASSEKIEELVLIDKRFNTVVSHRDIGMGISQVLPVLVSAYAYATQIVAIEQPEIHLHPALQAELGDVFIESALGERKNTFLLETHSEHLILRIMRRMRDTVRGTLPEGLPPVRPEDVAVLYVDRKDDDSTSVVTELALDEEGQLLDPWPGGFFEEGYNERFA